MLHGRELSLNGLRNKMDMKMDMKYNTPSITVDPVWKRKTCKSCTQCCTACIPGHRYRLSKPSNKVCKAYNHK